MQTELLAVLTTDVLHSLKSSFNISEFSQKQDFLKSLSLLGVHSTNPSQVNCTGEKIKGQVIKLQNATEFQVLRNFSWTKQMVNSGWCYSVTFDFICHFITSASHVRKNGLSNYCLVAHDSNTCLGVDYKTKTLLANPTNTSVSWLSQGRSSNQSNTYTESSPYSQSDFILSRVIVKILIKL